MGNYRRVAIGGGAVAHLAKPVVAPAFERAAILLRALVSVSGGTRNLLAPVAPRMSAQKTLALPSRGARGSCNTSAPPYQRTNLRL